jgi:hypothetical protein
MQQVDWAYSVIFFLNYKYNADANNTRTLTLMNTRMKILLI